MQWKGLERLFKRLATSGIERLMGQSVRAERPDWRERPYRVLFLRHDRIGDMILSTGILRAIAASHPTIQLDVLASPINAPVLRHEPYVHDVVVFNRRALLSFPLAFVRLRRRRYDAVIDCMVTAPSLTTLLLMLATGARHRIGVQALGNDFAYTLPVPARVAAAHFVDRLSALVIAFGMQPSALDLRPRVRLTPDEIKRGERVWRGEPDHSPRPDQAPRPNHAPRTGKRLLVNVSAGRGQRWWPDDRFIAVIRAARAKAPNAEIIVIGSPGDRPRAKRIAAEGGGLFFADSGIRDAMSIVARADLAFTPDTSIAHACSAFDKPAVVLHPQGSAAVWGPYETKGQSVESLTPTVTNITADEAIRALLDQLGRVHTTASDGYLDG